MIVRAPLPGVLEWTRDAQAPKRLAWLAVVDHCALLSIEAEGAPTWRRADELTTVETGEPIALLGDDPSERAECEQAEREATTRLLTHLTSELAALDARHDSPLQRQLLAAERRALVERIARLQR